VRRSGVGTPDVREVGALLDIHGVMLGEFSRTEHFRIETYVTRKGGETFRRKERIRLSQVLQLRWASELMETRIDDRAGTFSVVYGRQHVGTATVSSTGNSVDPLLLALLQNRADLFRLASAISLDLTRAFPEPPPVAEGCCNCGHLGCGLSITGQAIGGTRGGACFAAQTNVLCACSTPYCIGCCRGPSDPCDCSCVSGDLICLCFSYGAACTCDNPCV
jgi:hypothetical protein